MKRFVYPLICFLLIAVGCDIDQVDIDNLQTPRITSLVAVPIGEISFSLRELIDELDDSTVAIEEDSVTLLSLVYTDSFSYQSSNDLIDIGDITNSDSVDLPETPATPTSLDVLIDQAFTFTYPPQNQEQIDSVIYATGDLELRVTSSIAPVIDYNLTIQNTVSPSNVAVTLSGSVANSTDIQSQSLVGYKTILAEQNGENTFSVNFSGVIHLSAGQSIAAGDVIIFTLTYQNQSFDIIYGDFGRDTVEIGNQVIDVGFFADLGGEDAIEFLNPQVNINFRNTIGIPLGIAFGEVFAATTDSTGNTDSTFLSGSAITTPQLMGSPTVDEVGSTIESTVSLNRNNSDLAKLFGNAPESIHFNVSAISNPSATNPQNFFQPDNSTVEADVEFRLPLVMKLTDLQREQSFNLGDLKFTEADSVSLRIVTSNWLPVNTSMDLQILDENDSILYQVLNNKVMVSADQNVAAGFISYEPKVNVEDVPLSPDGIEALNNGDRINLVLTMNTPATVNSQEIFPKFLASYSLTVKLSAVGKLDYGL